jgi:hypothetical protein
MSAQLKLVIILEAQRPALERIIMKHALPITNAIQDFSAIQQINVITLKQSMQHVMLETYVHLDLFVQMENALDMDRSMLELSSMLMEQHQEKSES